MPSCGTAASCHAQFGKSLQWILEEKNLQTRPPPNLQA